MPRKGKIDYKPKHELDEPITLVSPAEQAPEDPDDQELDGLFSDMPQNENCLELYRTSQQGGRPIYLESLMPTVFSMAYVADNFGGGRYIIRGRYKNGEINRKAFEIAGDPFPIKRKIPELMREAMRDTMRPEEMQPYTRPQVEPVTAAQAGGNEMVAAMMTMMKTMMIEMKSSENDFLLKMRMYKEILGGGERKDAPLDQALSMLKQGIELGALQNSGDGGGSSIWLMALDKLKEPLTKIVDTIQVAVTQNRNQLPNVPVQAVSERPGVMAPIQPGDVSPSQPVEQPKGEPVQSSVILNAMKGFIPMLTTGATKGTDPELYVDLLLDQIPLPFYDKALAWLMEPDCLEQLARIEPGIRYQQEWWAALRGGLVSALNEELGHGVESVQPQPVSDSATERSADL